MNYGTARTTLTQAGYQPIPIIPNQKRPALADWTRDEYEPPPGYGNYGVGIRTGRGALPVYGVDVDCKDPQMAQRVTDIIRDAYGETLYRVGQQPKTLLLYRGEAAGIAKKTSPDYEIGHLEILGHGQQFVAFGTHPDTKRPYDWPGILGDISDLRPADLPVLTAADMDTIIQLFETEADRAGYKIVKKANGDLDGPKPEYDPDDPLDVKQPIGKSIDELREMVFRVDPDCGHDQWRNVGMALHHETGGSDDGLVLFDEWSRGGEKYKQGEPGKRWESFGKYTGRPITAAYLLKIAPRPQQHEDPENKTFFKRLPWSIRRFHPNAPDLPQIIKGMLSRGIVSLFFSAGGAGKSTLILTLCAKVAAAMKYGVQFFGREVIGGRVVILTAEDPDVIINKRLYATINALAAEFFVDEMDLFEALADRLFIVSTFGHAVQLFAMTCEGTLRVTDYYKSLVESLRDIEDLALLVVDTKTRYSPGEGSGNVIATQEIAHYEAIARKTGATVMLLHHTSKASRNGLIDGMQAYRDASGIYDSVRAAWYLRALTKEELKTQGVPEDQSRNYNLLENSKNNYLEINDSLIVKRDGWKFTAQPVKPKLSKAQVKEQQANEDLEMLIGTLQIEIQRPYGKGELLRLAGEKGISERRFRTALYTALEYDLLDEAPAGIRGAKTEYTLTQAGREWLSMA